MNSVRLITVWNIDDHQVVKILRLENIDKFCSLNGKNENKKRIQILKSLRFTSSQQGNTSSQ